MKILADLHHEDLYRSLHLLFEKRLGVQLWRPIGMEWFDRGYWRYPFPARETAAQFLDPNNYPDWRGITLQQFEDANTVTDYDHGGQFDLILSSTPPNFDCFEELRRKVAPHAKHIFQSGNDWPCPPGCRNFLNSTTVPTPKGVNGVHYHQEFDTQPPLGTRGKLKGDVINLMHYMPDYDRFWATSQLMPSWHFGAFGAGNALGPASNPVVELASTRYLWHSKPIEAYGFNVHRAAAFGKPLIMRARTNRHHTIGAIAGADGNTCLDLDDYTSAKDLAAGLLRFDEDYEAHSLAIKKAFRNAVDFDEEEIAIRRFMQRLT